MHYRDLLVSDSRLRMMRREIRHVRGEGPAVDLLGWPPADVSQMLRDWGFRSILLPGGAVWHNHREHPELEVTVPNEDPVQYQGVIDQAVGAIEALLELEGVSARTEKDETQP